MTFQLPSVHPCFRVDIPKYLSAIFPRDTRPTPTPIQIFIERVAPISLSLLPMSLAYGSRNTLSWNSTPSGLDYVNLNISQPGFNYLRMVMNTGSFTIPSTDLCYLRHSTATENVTALIQITSDANQSVRSELIAHVDIPNTPLTLQLSSLVLSELNDNISLSWSLPCSDISMGDLRVNVTASFSNGDVIPLGTLPFIFTITLPYPFPP